MIDGLQRRTALSDVALPSKPGSFDLRDAGPVSRVLFRGSHTAAKAVGMEFGLALPLKPCFAVSQGTRHALWLGPDEWMLICSEGDVKSLVSSLNMVIGSEPRSLVDVSHRNGALILEGLQAADVLNSGCPLNLDLAAFPVAACKRTLFGKAEIVLWRIAANSFRLEASRSLLPYVVALIAEAGRDDLRAPNKFASE